MRYLLIDRILRLAVNKSVLAIKNVSLSEDIYTEHFFGFPVMPGALLIEALAQAGTALIEFSSNFEKKAILVMVDQAKFRTLVKPGDQLHVEAEIISQDENSAQMTGIIRLAERRVMTAKLTFAIKDAADFFAPTAKNVVKMMYDAWLRDAEISGIETI